MIKCDLMDTNRTFSKKDLRIMAEEIKNINQEPECVDGQTGEEKAGGLSDVLADQQIEELTDEQTQELINRELEEESSDNTEVPPNPERPDYAAEITEIIRSDKTDEELFELLDDYHDNDLADAMELMSPEERSRFYKVLPADVVADIYERLEQDEVEEYLGELSDERVAKIGRAHV